MAKSFRFRREALEHYRRGGERGGLLRFARPPVALLSSLLLLLCALFLALIIPLRVPVYIDGVAMLHEPGATVQEVGSAKIQQVLIFIPVAHSQLLTHLVVGTSLFIYLDGAKQQISATLERVEQSVLSPARAQERYGPDAALLQSIESPSIVMQVKVRKVLLQEADEGRLVNVAVQISTGLAISLLSGSQ